MKNMPGLSLYGIQLRRCDIDAVIFAIAIVIARFGFFSKVFFKASNIENDERVFNAGDILAVCNSVGVPGVNLLR
jgi:hypothetical protein